MTLYPFANYDIDYDYPFDYLLLYHFEYHSKPIYEVFDLSFAFTSTKVLKAK